MSRLIKFQESKATISLKPKNDQCVSDSFIVKRSLIIHINLTDFWTLACSSHLFFTAVYCRLSLVEIDAALTDIKDPQYVGGFLFVFSAITDNRSLHADH